MHVQLKFPSFLQVFQIYLCSMLYYTFSLGISRNFHRQCVVYPPLPVTICIVTDIKDT